MPLSRYYMYCHVHVVKWVKKSTVLASCGNVVGLLQRWRRSSIATTTTSSRSSVSSRWSTAAVPTTRPPSTPTAGATVAAQAATMCTDYPFVRSSHNIYMRHFCVLVHYSQHDVILCVLCRTSNLTEPRRVTLIAELTRVTEGCYVNTTSHFQLAEDNGECGCTSSKGIAKLYVTMYGEAATCMYMCTCSATCLDRVRDVRAAGTHRLQRRRS